MTQPRIKNADNILKAAKCCLASQILDINSRRKKTIRRDRLDEEYKDAFFLSHYIKIIDDKTLRNRMGNVGVSNVIDRINNLCNC